MAVVCDLDSGREDVQAVRLSVHDDEGDDNVDLASFDLCKPCRSFLAERGVRDGIITRWARKLQVRQRGSALKAMLDAHVPRDQRGE